MTGCCGSLSCSVTTTLQTVSTTSMLLVFLLVTSEPVTSRLVLQSWSDLDREDGSVDTERLAREADLLSVTSEPDPTCPQVELEVAEYELEVSGKTLSYKVKTRKDTWNVTKTISVENVPGLQGTVVLR